jgi:hypothetical protein
MYDLLADLKLKRSDLIAEMSNSAYGDETIGRLAELQGAIAAIEAVAQDGLAHQSSARAETSIGLNG